VKLTASGACKFMNAQKYLAQANGQIAELTVQIARQRVIVRHALDTGQRSEMAESLLDALEGTWPRQVFGSLFMYGTPFLVSVSEEGLELSPLLRLALDRWGRRILALGPVPRPGRSGRAIRLFAAARDCRAIAIYEYTPEAAQSLRPTLLPAGA
jgi:hypothetical protein